MLTALRADIAAAFRPRKFHFDAFIAKREALVRLRVLQGIRERGRQRSPILWMPAERRRPKPISLGLFAQARGGRS